MNIINNNLGKNKIRRQKHLKILKEQKKIIETRKIKEKNDIEEKEQQQKLEREQIVNLTETIEDLKEKYKLLCGKITFF